MVMMLRSLLEEALFTWPNDRKSAQHLSVLLLSLLLIVLFLLSTTVVMTSSTVVVYFLMISVAIVDLFTYTM